MILDDRADDFERESLGGRIDGQHAPFAGATLVVTEVDELPRLQLPTVEEAHAAGHEQRVALRDRSVEKRLTGPRDLDHPRLVAQDGLEDSQAATCRDDPF